MRLFWNRLRQYLAWGANWRLAMIERMKKTDKRTTETEQRKAERALADAG